MGQGDSKPADTSPIRTVREAPKAEVAYTAYSIPIQDEGETSRRFASVCG